MVDDISATGAGGTARPRRRPSCRSSSRAPPTGSGTAWCGRRTGRTWPATTAQPFFAFIFDPRRAGPGRPGRHARRVPRRRGASSAGRRSSTSATAQVRPNKRIDTNISTPLFHLPLGAIASGDPPDVAAAAQPAAPPHLVASRPGQAIAAAMGVAPLGAAELPGAAAATDSAWTRSTPLWYYVLKEAELLEDGLRLGPGRRPDRGRGVHRPAAARPERATSRCSPGWQPTLPTRTAPATSAWSTSSPSPESTRRPGTIGNRRTPNLEAVSDRAALLELLYTARDRWRTARLTLRDWTHLERSQLAYERHLERTKATPSAVSSCDSRHGSTASPCACSR